MPNKPTPTTLATILAQFREDARNNRDLGDRFERLIQSFLETDPLYADHFSNVWMWNDWPDKGAVGDVGIDLVARERATGNYIAIQCKFYLPEHTLSKKDIDSFFTAAGRDPFTAGIIVSTTDRWGKNAEDALNQSKPVTRISLHDLELSPIDWSQFDARRGGTLSRRPRKSLRPHQTAALKDVIAGFSTSDRGKLIMACGTGKTFTALRIAETIAPTGHILFLVPSLSLLAQSLREWTAESENPIHSLAVCSDTSIGKSRKRPEDDSAEITLHDLAFPATTNAKQLVSQYQSLINPARKPKPGQPASAPAMTVVFSTYQSISAVSQAQKSGFPTFDLIICDEAHRTTGVTLAGEDESEFVKVHDANFLKAKKRLYMTATPRLFGDDARTKAQEAAAELCSMDDPELFGPELHRLGFGEAVGKNLLADYKVLVLAVDEKYVATAFQKQLADDNNELNLPDAVKIIGCWNGLAKRFDANSTSSTDLQGDVAPMRRAVAFSRSIRDSQAFVGQFHQLVAAYKESNPDAVDVLNIEADHVDGTFDALRRGARLDWLRADSPPSTCRVLSNARCLSEGVDVPALDAVLFLNPRNSVIDVVQSVGRVMRRAEGKTFGYIILPVGIPADIPPEEALKDNDRYRVVWQVLQALRAHDDRFNATINQLQLNRKRPDNIQVIGVRGTDDDSASPGNFRPTTREIQSTFNFPELENWKDAIYGKIVLKCGDRAYWQTWAKDIATIADTHISRLKALIDAPKAPHAKAFDEFLTGLQSNLNPAVTKDDAIEMLAQHLITRPVFDALFENYAFTQHNPVSQSMEKMLAALQDESLSKEAQKLDKFYASVRDRASKLDNAEARQKVIIELYDEFFKNAFPRMAERLGIVYTPVEVVDFIIHSVEDILRDEFNSGLGHKDVHIIDPFTGTGTFLVRLLQSGLIPPKDLLRKYQHELHANEIVLLAYYIAAINIEETFHSLHHAQTGKAVSYLPFDGIVLTDTFQLFESSQGQITGTFPENTARVTRQKSSPIRVVIANPPYSVGQGDANANNQNLDYPALDARIAATYAKQSTATLKNSLYDSYIRAIRWASDRIDKKGIVGLVTNGSFIDGNTTDGLRACLTAEFTSIYIFNLRGNARSSGEIRRKESGNVFGSGSQTPVAITLLVKNPARTTPATLQYHDIGDYLSRDEKLGIVRKFASIAGIGSAKSWITLDPNEQHDWINQRDPTFETFISIGDKKSKGDDVVFDTYSHGVATSRDTWVYNFSTSALNANVQRTISFYDEEVTAFLKAIENVPKEDLASFADDSVTDDAKKISWSRGLKRDLVKGIRHEFQEGALRTASYRPFYKQWLYLDDNFVETPGQMLRVFPRESTSNIAIGVKQRWSGQGQLTLMANCIADLQTDGGWQYFPLYLYESTDDSGKLNLGQNDGEVIDGYRRRDAITDAILKTFHGAYGPKVTKEDIFYYVYGVLHSPEYRTRFAADLKKMLPRIPLTRDPSDFITFSKAGRDLAHWHLNYETVEPYPLQEFTDVLTLEPAELYKVTKMTFARPTPEQKAQGLKWDKSTLNYNSHIKLTGIPLDAYDYVVNGKPALEWIIERYQVTRDKDSGITNDPNDWAKEHNQPRYILDLIKRVVRVSLETNKIVASLPPLNEIVAAKP